MLMWEARKEEIAGGVRYEMYVDDSRLSFRGLFHLLETNREYGEWYSDTLAGAPFEAFFWEHPALTSGCFDADAEFVLVESTSLANAEPEPEPFAKPFDDTPDPDVIVFPNLGRDAMLVAPKPVGPIDAYRHLGSFVREAPRLQVVTLWGVVGRTLRERLNIQPIWLSTAGLGVSWLHVRLDTRPKYYTHAPYKTA
jgi:hypothetical protein